MADSITTNLALTQPEVGASTDTWGSKLNTDLGLLDALFSGGPLAPALLVSKGGTGAVDAPTARVNLGCGTIATQNANAVAIAGGAIENTPIGASTPSTGEFTTLRADTRVILGSGVLIQFGDATTQSTAAGTFTAGVQTPTTSVTLTATYQDHMVKADATSGTLTVNLFTASGNLGRRVSVKKMDSSVNSVVIDGAGAEVVDGALTQTLYRQYDALTLYCDGAGWLLI